MQSYKNILLAVDLKPEDDESVSQKAAQLAKNSKGQLTIIHVLEPIYNYGIPPGTESKFDQWQTELEQSAKQELSRLGSKISVPHERQHLAIGQIKEQILLLADKIGADLIVVGCHGRHGWQTLFMGDTAGDMLSGAKCDVLAVHVGE